MSRVKITAPNALYDGKVGDLQFSKGVYEGEAPDAIVNYCRATGYGVEEVGTAQTEPPSPIGADGIPVLTDAKSYSDMKVAELKAVIDTRNEGRDAEQQLSKSGKQADLIAALEADDKAQAEAASAEPPAGDGNDENGAAQ